ncbi:rho GTPase-activating protein 6-like isoform X2 [Gigantopelta aegis]|uniref:rho GTPase-activating protein 6-like isoform X2 n=1 Tax=Gigantopelta aegis TaxID=1735272 RepID=UPI001B8899A8|nr:rho GTPase-activating protein 6-like isoform X2 [Gigantopelta aegis]
MGYQKCALTHFQIMFPGIYLFCCRVLSHGYGSTITTLNGRCEEKFEGTAMHKAKSPSPGHKILPKRWRSKTKPLPNTVAKSLWSPETSCTWCSMSGRKVVLKPVSLFQLTEAERLALQKVALTKLQEMELGCPLIVPKENGDSRRSKRHTISIKRRSRSANLGGLLDVLVDKTKEKEQKDAGLVFGIPLSKCISNDNKLKKSHSTSTSTLKARSESADILLSPRPRKSSSSSQSSMDNAPHNGSMLSTNSAYRRTASSDSLSESESSRNTSSSLIDALSLSLSDSRQCSLPVSHTVYATGRPQVPEVVQVCFRHLEMYGLRVLGIFRVGAAKKRVKQLRDDFDSGKESPLNDSHQPHDVGALLKEYFRDLPEPLLTRDLYQAFIATRKIKDRPKQLMAFRLLIALLPLPSRDTVWALMRFLHTVAQHSADFIETNGNVLPGNKMDSHNLATLFGPNILHKAKISEKEFLVECTEQAEQSKEVIEVIKDMIDNHHEIFEVTPELHDEVIRVLMETNPEVADKVLKRLSNESLMEPDPDTSSSVFDDSDSPSLPHSPSSDADLVSQSRRLQLGHQALRVTKSADPRTNPVIQIESDNRRTLSSSEDKRCPTISVEGTPSPKPHSPFSYRKPKLKSPRESSSPEIHLRPQHDSRDRPYSEGFSHSLAIPKVNYLRENSSSSISSYLSSPNSPVGSESSIQWASHSPSNSPNPLRRSSSQSRPLNLQTADPRQDVKSTIGSAEWQRESWHHWELIAAEKAADTYEQETLV